MAHPVSDLCLYASKTADRLASLVLMVPEELECIPDLKSLHQLMQESFLTRRDEELRKFVEARSAGRPPSKQEQVLKESIAAEKREYLENMEIPDLLNPTNVRLMRNWNGDAQALGQYRMVRISGTQTEQYVQVQAGLHKDLALADEAVAACKTREKAETVMQTDEA